MASLTRLDFNQAFKAIRCNYIKTEKSKIEMKKLKNLSNRFLLNFKVRRIARIYKNKSGKKLFIDGGSNLGQGYSFFSRYFSPNDYDVVFIEPNPNCMKEVKKKFNYIKDAKFLEKAIWIKEEKLNFFGLVEDQRGNTSTGGSVVESHNNSMYLSDESQSISVDAFSFSDFLFNIGREYDTVIVKLDIESAEYMVLKDLISKNTITIMDHLFVEFHSQYYDVSERPIYQKLEKELLNIINSKGIGFTKWI